ncbi:MAG: hypothetical protein IIA68_00560 [Proteobacteria bacterium]|nr:hypothetical protein [Pseudomonadota bacterium]
MTATVTVLLCLLAAPAAAERLIVIATAPVAGVTFVAGGALCNGRIDAFVLPLSHPNGAVAAATGACGAVFVEVSGPAVEFPAPSGRQARLPMLRHRLRAPSLPRKRATRSYGYRLLDIDH